MFLRRINARLQPVGAFFKSRLFRRILLFVCLTVFLTCAVILAFQSIRSYQNRKLNRNLAGKVKAVSSQNMSGVTSSSTILDKFADLYSQNSDFAGWIKIPGTNIDYPVLQRKTESTNEENNDYYLHHDFYKNSSYYGEPSLDTRCSIQPLSKDTIIYGHNMGDDQMFHELLNYKNLDFYKSSPIVQFDTIYGEYKWKIFSVFITDTLEDRHDVFNYINRTFTQPDDFLNFIGEVKKRTLINTSVDVEADDRVLTLSTCAYDFKKYERFVVMGRLVRSGEDTSVGDAQMNPQPLMPDVWYSIFGGKKPDI